MSRAGVFFSEIDISTTVRSQLGFYASCQIKAPKGSIDKPILIGRDINLLREFTPDETVKVGYDDNFYEALAYLQKGDKLWVSRVIKNGGYASAKVYSLNYETFTGNVVSGATTFDLVTGYFSTTNVDLIQVLQNGAAFKFQAGTLLPDPLVTGTIYYFIKIGVSTFQIAASREDALAATPIPIDLTAVQKTELVTFDANSDLVTLATSNLDGLLESGNQGYFNIVSGSVLATPLQENVKYYIKRKDATNFYICATKDKAVRANLTFTTDFNNSSTNLNITNHGLIANEPVQLVSTVSLPNGLVSSQTYYVKQVVDANTITVSLTIGGSVVNFSNNGSGVHSLISGFVDLLSSGTGSSNFTISKDTSINNISVPQGITTSLSSAYTVNFNTDIITVTDTSLINQLGTGVEVMLSVTGGNLSLPLQENTYYYLIETATPGQYQLAETLDDAINNNFINIINAGTGTFKLSIKLKNPLSYNFEDDVALLFYNANPGLWGNALAVKLKDNRVKEADSFIVEVYKLPDLVTPVENFVVSRKQSKKDGYNQNIFIENVLKRSKYIRCNNNELIDENVFPLFQAKALRLAGGNDGDDVTEGDLILDLNAKFSSPSKVPTTVFFDGVNNTPNYQKALLALAEKRGDSVAVLGVPYSAEVDADRLNSIVQYKTETLNVNTSYGGIYTPHVKIYDSYNAREDLILSPTGYITGLISETGTKQAIWVPVAGKTRGVFNTISGLVAEFEDAELDFLYDNGINPIRFILGDGIYLWGQKTLLNRPSALDRMNVRLLLTYIEPAIKVTLEQFVFEINDAPTRDNITGIISSYLGGIQARKGLYGYLVICNDVNNTADEIDNNELHVWIFIKPTKSAEYIPAKLIITRTNADFGLAADLLV